MPVPKKLIEEIRKAINKEYPSYSIKRRRKIRNAIIYGKLGFGRGNK